MKDYIKGVASAIFETKSLVDAVISGGIAPMINISSIKVRKLRKGYRVSIFYEHETFCGYMDHVYHVLPDIHVETYEFTLDGKYKGDINKALNPYKDTWGKPYVEEFFREHSECIA